MMGLLLFLKSPIGRGLGISLIFLGVLGACTVQTERLKRTKADLATAKALLYVPDIRTGKPTRVTWQAAAALAEASLNTCRASVSNLETAVARQNASLEAAKAEGDRKARDLAKALQAAQKQGMAAQANAERILGIDARGGDTCQRLLDAERQITESTR